MRRNKTNLHEVAASNDSREGNRSEMGVQLPAEHTGSSLFHHVLRETVDAFPDVLASSGFPDDPKTFKQRYGQALVRFEAARVASPRRVEVARFIARRTQHWVELVDDSGRASLEERLAEQAPAPKLHCEAFRGPDGLRAEVPFGEETYRGSAVVELAERLHRKHQMTDAALAAVRWIVQHIDQRGGKLSLAGQRFAVLGAGAELAPTPLLLAAGADVLYIDVGERIFSHGVEMRLGDFVEKNLGHGSGRLFLPTGVNDILQQPREIAAAITAFANEGPVHIGMFAYAAGASREWRLGAAMNAIVRSLDAAVPASISLFISPTTAATMQREDVEAATTRFAARPTWQTMLSKVGALPTPGHFEYEGRCISRSIVSIQGLSYQAAQYISKMCAVESYAVYGLSLRDGDSPKPLRVSANVAGITNTRSLAHPLFQAAFVGASRFGVQVFQPPTTRALNGLLMLHDLLNPDAPGAASMRRDGNGSEVTDQRTAERLLAQQVHGGIYGLPYPLEQAIRAAAVIGMARKPSVLRGRALSF